MRSWLHVWSIIWPCSSSSSSLYVPLWKSTFLSLSPFLSITSFRPRHYNTLTSTHKPLDYGLYPIIYILKLFTYIQHYIICARKCRIISGKDSHRCKSPCPQKTGTSANWLAQTQQRRLTKHCSTQHFQLRTPTSPMHFNFSSTHLSIIRAAHWFLDNLETKRLKVSNLPIGFDHCYSLKSLWHTLSYTRAYIVIRSTKE